MRRHRNGGNSNQRELDAIQQELLPVFCAGVPENDIAIITPYRPQADKAELTLGSTDIESDTVHKFQGRQKRVVILSTVLDETWRGRLGVTFVDDPHLVNVAVSRAAERFILVTDHAMLPHTTHIRDLIGYVAYHDRDHDVVDSRVISVFDLLYHDYAARLTALSRRMKKVSRYQSENIVGTLLNDIVNDSMYHRLTVAKQLLLRDLVGDLTSLTQEQYRYIHHRSSVDFVIFNRVTKKPLLAIEVDGFAFHENNPEQLARDHLKDSILAVSGLPSLRLPTTGSGEEKRIRQALDSALASEQNRPI